MPQVPDIVGVYRITHLDNIPLILRDGIYAMNSVKPDAHYRFIADQAIIDRRATKAVPVAPGGTLADYVPFYFGERSVMLYTINKREMAKQEEVVYLLVKLDSIERHNCTYCFTDGHASSALTTFYSDRAKMSKLDWEAIKAHDFRNTEDDPDRMRKKSAELLVKHHLPPTCIDHLVCYNEVALQKLKQFVLDSGLSIPSSIQQSRFYF
ncbi:DUF4433 domain-containing protein [Lewinella sp. JB7]|uniref:type II toxin-antitoxin system toxin DNA ADP-ribosyl transferase DarT n=1 Tax=Lewinella sp. JB7 TaxID=2962887 RepID=UPI0020C9B01F|nr:DUF4433 domain-containing protein [Lewinella sp. JB7]MCP9234747.1 DUF4433 domain-containing protein [Lewinella sp. JB7]